MRSHPFVFTNRARHRDLHSFPTRRSSDLRDDVRLRMGLASAPAWLPRRHQGRGNQAGAERSEEHTSELQSRFDLVCRLLLEKKKFSDVSGEIVRQGVRLHEMSVEQSLPDR